MVDNQWLARQLLARGLASEAQIKVAAGRGDNLGETLVATQVVKEIDLLRLLSLHYKTQYITRSKLLTAKIPPRVLELIPEVFCKRYNVLPVRFDSQQAILSMLLLDPADEALLDAVRWEVQKKRPVRQVRPYVALSASIHDAIMVFLGGVSPDDLPQRQVEHLPEPEPEPEPGPADASLQFPVDFQTGQDTARGPDPSRPAEAQTQAPDPPPAVEGPGLQPPPAQPGGNQPRMTILGLGSDELQDMAALERLPDPTADMRKPPLEIPSPPAAPAPAAPKKDRPAVAPVAPKKGRAAAAQQEALEELISVGTVTPIVSIDDLEAQVRRTTTPGASVRLSTLLRLTRILVWQWEKALGWRNEHSLQVARLCRKVGRHAGLPDHALNTLKLAALLHEMGQPTTQHISAMSLQERPELQDLCRRSLGMLTDLLDAASVPKTVRKVLEAQFELPNGDGIPGQLSGDDISQEANILTVVDSYLDLINNPGAPGGLCGKEAALQRMRAAGERRVLCPLTVELLHQVVSPAALRERILGELATVLLVDPERSAHLGLVGALRSEKAEVRAVIDPARAVRVALREAVDLIICELNLKPLDGLELLRRLRADERTKDLPILLVVNQANSLQLDEAMVLGIEGVLYKPYSMDEVLLTILPHLAKKYSSKQELRRVSGSLSEIPLVDIIRALTARKKSGLLSLRLGYQKGEIRLHEGKVVQAYFAGRQGEEAFSEMLGLTDGDFALDPVSLTKDPRLANPGGDLIERSGAKLPDIP